jgi:hypothetical protein
MSEPSPPRSAAWLGGCAAIGLLVTGVAGLGMAGLLALESYVSLSWGEPVPIALALVASALAFGFLINSIYRR